MAQADQQRLHHHYVSGNTGMDMPMDQASRMERAGQMGFDTKAYHGTKDDFPAFDKRAYAASNYGVHTGAKDAANTILMHSKSRYDKSFGASDYPNKSAILPLMIKTKNNLRISDTGDWQPNKVMSAMAWSENPETEAMYRSIEDHPSFPRFGTDDEKTKFIADSLEQAGHTGFTYRNDYEGGGDSHATLDPTNIRSQFARFDPRLEHLAHLSASTGGAMEFARHVEAVNRAGGQIAPSKYLPNVPRAVHADGGRENGEVVNLGKEKLVRSITKAVSNVKSGAHQEMMDQRAYKLHESGHLPLPIGTKVTPPQGWDVPSQLQIHGYWQDILHPDQHGYKLKSEDGDVYDVQHHMHSEQNPYVFGGGFRAYSGPVRNRSGYSDEAIASKNPTLPMKTPERSAEINKEYDQLFGNDPDITKADGGRAGYADGGSPLGLYSKAAQIIRNQPQAKGNVDQLLAMVSKAKGVKPTELANAGRPAGDTMSKEELAQHFEQALPKVDVERIGGRDSNGFPQYEDYTLPGGENYREHLLHLSDEREPPKPIHRVMGAFPRDFDSEDGARQYIRQLDTLRNTPGMEGIAESLTRYPAIYQREEGRSTDPNDFKSSHWNTPNVLAHVRMDDRDNGKTLHVQEVQSDWGQEGREKGFSTGEKGQVKQGIDGDWQVRWPDGGFSGGYSEESARRVAAESRGIPKGPYVGNTQQWTDLALKHVLMEAAKGGHDRVVFSPGEANADLYGQRKEVGMLKFLKSKDSGEAGILSAYSKDGRRSSEHEVGSHGELAKLIGKENATNLLAQNPTQEPDNGEDVYAHRLQGPLQVGGHGMVDYYKNYVHAGALKLLQQHDPSIKPESYDLPEGYKGFSLPMTDTARQSILKNGFQAFKDGGEVNKATGGPVMGYVPFAPIQIRQLAVAPIVPQQQQQTAGSFSKSLMSLMDTANEFKKKPEEPTPSASSEGHTPSGMIPLPEEGYQPSGMYAPFQSAIDQMISDAPGKISVASGYRTPERQAELWEAAAAKYPDPEVRDNWVARPGDSSHNYGLAADLSYADEEALKWAQENAARYGLNFRMDNEDWHIEPTNVFDIRSAMTIPGYATGGSVSKALSITRGFTKDGKSAIGSLKPKGK
jgi:hypothetical protein